MQKRSAVILMLYMIAMFVVMLRIYQIGNDERVMAAQEQGTITVTVAAPRGTIYDCNLRSLTNVTDDLMAVLTPTPAVAAEINRCFGAEEAADILARLRQGMPFAQRVPTEFSAEGAYLFAVPRRYGEQQLAPHVIGYLDGGNQSGAAGIEKGYNDHLTHGHPLTVTFAKNAVGRVFDGTPPKFDRSLADTTVGIALTLDTELQELAEQAAKKAFERGAVVVMECDTGKIRAMVSLPHFSPNKVGEVLNETANAPLINRAITPYNVGSVYKLCVAAAAIESGVPTGFSHTCRGAVQIGQNNFRCAGSHEHGTLGLETALEVSCNTYFITLGQHTGAQPIYDMSRAMGFGQVWNLGGGIFTKEGSLPDLTLLSTQPATLANTSFGQGDLLLTPLNIACMTAAIACEGKSPAPTLIEGEVTAARQLILSPYVTPPTNVMSKTTAAILKQYMINVVETGTGTRALPETGGAGGKTGTAQTGWIENGSPVEQAWFCGFYPADRPRYAIVALAENGRSGGSTTAPVFKEIADGITRLEAE